MIVGRIYLLKGGTVARYRGPQSGWGEEAVIREVTQLDAEFLRERQAQLLARKLVGEAEWIAEVMQEVGAR